MNCSREIYVIHTYILSVFIPEKQTKRKMELRIAKADRNDYLSRIRLFNPQFGSMTLKRTVQNKLNFLLVGD
ncbi:hypothetical protein RB195_009477 [Necator americanus]|uniref:Uncharacterized protein n=1 Tax=Necator americanus TaxID=51031 RepID=A0ABR1CUQ6_NECAM